MIAKHVVLAAIFIPLCFNLQLMAQGNVGIGTPTPVTKLNVVGEGSNPSIPGATSPGVLRIGINDIEGMDVGKQSTMPFSVWMQTGFNGAITDPLSLQPLGGNVGIGIISPAPSAVLDLNSTTQGFLPPRMTLTQRNAIATPEEGLTIYNTTSNCLETWDGSIWFGPCNIQAAQYPAETVFCSGKVTKVVPVINPITGKTWMDRNLGADRAALSSSDAESYGSLFQWGRAADGHQCVHRYASDGVTTSETTNTIATSSVPNAGNVWDGLFILGTDDWLTPHDDLLWQGLNGPNNPCPSGYRLPTQGEWFIEQLSWVQPPINSTDNANGAFASPLKLPTAGARGSGGAYNEGSDGNYWSSTIYGSYSFKLHFSYIAEIVINPRITGYSVRCIKN